jgi:hypothetical protein
MHEDLEAPGAQSDSGIEVAVPDVVRNFPFFHKFTTDSSEGPASFS